MEPRLAGKQYRDTYMELSGTVTPDTKIFVQDMGEPGLSPKKQENMYDTWTQAGKIVMFDGENEKQKMSDADTPRRLPRPTRNTRGFWARCWQKRKNSQSTKNFLDDDGA